MGFMILAGIMLLFLGGMTFFIAQITRPSNTDLFSSREGVGIIELKGIITSSDKTLAHLNNFKNNNKIKAIVVRVDSPGGSVGASQEIFREIRRIGLKKPVIASMGSVAASGGYYVAIGADKIIASPGTLTGSMGVILKFANLEEIFKKIGYRSEIIKSGEFKDMGSPSRSLTEVERLMLQALLDNVHDQFIRDIAESRGLVEDDVRKVADGRIFSGEQALELGLIDEFGNLNDAVQLAAKLGGILDSDPRMIYPASDDFNLLRLLGGENAEALLCQLFGHKTTLAYEWPLAR